MSKGRILAVLAVLSVTVTALAGSEESPMAEDAVRAAEQGFADAFAAHDLERFASFIHEEAVFTGRDGPLQGKDAVLAVWRGYVERDEPPFSWAPERVLVSRDGTMGSTTGPVRDPSGRWVGAFASTWIRQPDGRWQVVFDISPSCPPPQP